MRITRITTAGFAASCHFLQRISRINCYILSNSRKYELRPRNELYMYMYIAKAKSFPWNITQRLPFCRFSTADQFTGANGNAFRNAIVTWQNNGECLLGPISLTTSNGISVESAVFAGFTVVTNRRTTHATQPVPSAARYRYIYSS